MVFKWSYLFKEHKFGAAPPKILVTSSRCSPASLQETLRSQRGMVMKNCVSFVKIIWIYLLICISGLDSGVFVGGYYYLSGTVVEGWIARRRRRKNLMQKRVYDFLMYSFWIEMECTVPGYCRRWWWIWNNYYDIRATDKERDGRDYQQKQIKFHIKKLITD